LADTVRQKRRILEELKAEYTVEYVKYKNADGDIAWRLESCMVNGQPADDDTPRDDPRGRDKNGYVSITERYAFLRNSIAYVYVEMRPQSVPFVLRRGGACRFTRDSKYYLRDPAQQHLGKGNYSAQAQALPPFVYTQVRLATRTSTHKYAYLRTFY